ncbi:hypothetical protein QYM36_013569 [Artemia franciscana]|uniref:Uncharacterized protein n=1 Tax=Artemia franciscana TaxID=6661 RepID=A0AA88KYX2_ARTSF|nr:hypothetical protein QYM36_013569 [Artemia franciscana]
MANDIILSQRSRVKQKRHRQYYLGEARKVQKMQNDLKEMQQVLNMHYCNTEDSKEAIKLEFAHANNVIEMATNSLAKRHALNAAKCEKFLDNLPEDEPPTLEDFTTAMGNLRQHSQNLKVQLAKGTVEPPSDSDTEVGSNVSTIKPIQL